MYVYLTCTLNKQNDVETDVILVRYMYACLIYTSSRQNNVETDIISERHVK